MRSMKKMTAVIMAAAMAMSLSACGGGKGIEKAGDSTTAAPAAEGESEIWC